MHIEYQIAEDEFVSAAKLAMVNRSKVSTFWRYALPVWGWIIVIFAVIGAVLQSAVSSAVAPLVVGLVLVSWPLLRNYQFSKQYRKSPMLQERRQLDIDDEGVRFASLTSDGHVAWQGYSSFAENALTFILWQQGNLIFIPISKRDLTPDQISELRNQFEMHLGRR